MAEANIQSFQRHSSTFLLMAASKVAGAGIEIGSGAAISPDAKLLHCAKIGAALGIMARALAFINQSSLDTQENGDLVTCPPIARPLLSQHVVHLRGGNAVRSCPGGNRYAMAYQLATGFFSGFKLICCGHNSLLQEAI